MKAGIVIDNWKLPIFERHLSRGGFIFEESGAITDDSMLLMVDVGPALVAALSATVKAANAEAANTRRGETLQ